MGAWQVALSPDGRWLGAAGGAVTLWDLDAPTTPPRTVPGLEVELGELRGRTVAWITGADGSLDELDLATAARRPVAPPPPAGELRVRRGPGAAVSSIRPVGRPAAPCR